MIYHISGHKPIQGLDWEVHRKGVSRQEARTRLCCQLSEQRSIDRRARWTGRWEAPFKTMELGKIEREYELGEEPSPQCQSFNYLHLTNKLARPNIMYLMTTPLPLQQSWWCWCRSTMLFHAVDSQLLTASPREDLQRNREYTGTWYRWVSGDRCKYGRSFQVTERPPLN